MPTKYLTFSILLCMLSVFLLSSVATLAQEAGVETFRTDPVGRLIHVGDRSGFEEVNRESLPKTVGLIIRGFIAIVGVIFLVYIFYAGYLWLAAAGNEELIAKSKKIMRASIIGLVIVMGTYLITLFIVEIFENAGIYNFG